MNAIFISTAPEVIWNTAIGRHRAALWNTAFEAVTVPTESGQLFDMGGGEMQTSALKRLYLL